MMHLKDGFTEIIMSKCSLIDLILFVVILLTRVAAKVSG